MDLFEAKMADHSLSLLKPTSLEAMGATEPRDLEALLANAPSIFGREILWITRQGTTESGDRSDLTGIDASGNLVVAELKRGEVYESAVTQALRYASVYAGYDKERLAEEYFKHSAKGGSSKLFKTVASEDEALNAIDALVGKAEEKPVNDAQTVLLVGERFSAECLRLCDYLTRVSDGTSISLECWEVHLWLKGAELLFGLDKAFPPRSTEEEIREKVSIARSRKWANNTKIINFARWVESKLYEKLLDSGRIVRARRQYKKYGCYLSRSDWSEIWLLLDLSIGWPVLIVPGDFEKHGELPPDVEVMTTKEGGFRFEWRSVDVNSGGQSDSFLEQLSNVMSILDEKHSSGEGEPVTN